MSDTLGSLIDKLITTDLKLWHVQDKVHAAAVVGKGLDAETVRQLNSLNRQRNKLMSDIDRAGGGEVEERVKF